MSLWNTFKRIKMVVTGWTYGVAAELHKMLIVVFTDGRTFGILYASFLGVYSPIIFGGDLIHRSLSLSVCVCVCMSRLGMYEGTRSGSCR